MKRQIHLALYGTVDHGPEHDLAWQLYQSQAMARLRDISLSSTPSRFAPHGVATSRFQHSVAVGYLARLLCDRRPSLREHRDLLMAAGLLHDIGSPPFSHIAELFFFELSGRTHEQQTELLLRPRGELADILGAYGVDSAQVVRLINGDPSEPLSRLIAGSIDLDNVSNTIDLLASLGYHDQLPYHPLDLVGAFRYRHGEVVLDTDYLPQLLGWARARQMLYGLLFSEPNLSAATMLYRALEYAFAAGRLDESFFAMGESDALHFLSHAAGRNPRTLLDMALRWRHYPLLYERIERAEDPRLVGLYADWRARKRLTDELASELGIAPMQLTLYVGRDRGAKAIKLPFIGADAEAARLLFSGGGGTQRLAVFAHKDHQHLRGSHRVAQTLERLIGQLPVREQPGHSFF